MGRGRPRAFTRSQVPGTARKGFSFRHKPTPSAIDPPVSAESARPATVADRGCRYRYADLVPGDVVSPAFKLRRGGCAWLGRRGDDPAREGAELDGLYRKVRKTARSGHVMSVGDDDVRIHGLRRAPRRRHTPVRVDERPGRAGGGGVGGLVPRLGHVPRASPGGDRRSAPPCTLRSSRRLGS